MFTDENLIPLFQELMGLSGIKPFECVGTNEEMILALWLISQKEKPDSRNLISSLFIEKILPQFSLEDARNIENKLLFS